jgi:hypothetical protein
MPNADKLKAQLLKLLDVRDQGAKLNRVEDWLA